MTSLLANQSTWLPPGSQSAYHSLTQGYLVGELVRRIDGRSVGQFFAEEIGAPLGADFHIGVSPEDDDAWRWCSGITLNSVTPEAIRLCLGRSRSGPQTPCLQPRILGLSLGVAPIPAASGHGNARSVAIAQSVVSGGGAIRGINLLSKEIIGRIFEVQAAGQRSRIRYRRASLSELDMR